MKGEFILRNVPVIAPADAAAHVHALEARLHTVLQGQHPTVVMAALASCTAICLAGHQVQPKALRKLIDAQLQHIRKLVPLYQKAMDAELRKMSGGRTQ